ncbi:MAG: NAD(P)-dependent oxidoreductase [Candidatus Poribacteria bacterium]|nr:NAD(P)-dependent oxidoreductase [Candidatus Poribacteria bacterium]
MKILVTGISGRIGANLAKALIDAGHEVRGLVWTKDLRVEKLEGLPVKLIEGSLVNAADVNQAVEGVEAICHLGAAFQGGGPFTNEDYFEINARGTFNMLEAARENGDHLEHFFFASTDATYSKYVPGGMSHPIREDEMPQQPGGWYALSKVLGEEMCRGYYRSYRLPITIFRFANVSAGEEILNFGQFRLSQWLKTYEGRAGEAASQTRQQLQEFWTGEERLLIARDENGRSYKKHIADVRDIVLGFLSALGKPAAIGETFQLAAPKPFTWEETIPYLADKLGMDYVDVRLQDNTPTYYEFDLSKGARLIGYAPQFDIFKMIDSAIAFREGNATDVIPTQIS